MTIEPRRIACLFTILLSTAMLLALPGCGGGPVPAPTSYATYETKDGGFAVEYPEGWDADGGGKKNSWAKFSKGTAEISLQTDLVGSLMGDMGAGMGNKLGPPDPEDYPVHKVHVADKETVAQEYSDYKEQEPVEFQNAIGGPGRKSEFTASGTLSGPIHGYRATFLGRDKRFRVTLTCSESDWENLKPAFDKVLESFRSAG
jgi:hypothetical protein